MAFNAFEATLRRPLRPISESRPSTSGSSCGCLVRRRMNRWLEFKLRSPRGTVRSKRRSDHSRPTTQEPSRLNWLPAATDCNGHRTRNSLICRLILRGVIRKVKSIPHEGCGRMDQPRDIIDCLLLMVERQRGSRAIPQLSQWYPVRSETGSRDHEFFRE